MLANNAFNNSLFSVIASKSNMAFVNLRYEDLDSTVWLDDCHTNAYGNYQIAKATSLVLQQVIETRILASP
jgi:hypothetical protein